MKQFNNLTILATETSCDDTCMALIKASGRKKPKLNILSNVVSSQVKIHQKWGGVYPSLAKREHQKMLVPVLMKALSKIKMPKNPKFQISMTKQIPPKQSLRDATGQANSKFQTVKKILAREEYLFRKLKKFLTKYQKPKIDFIAVTVGPGLEPCLWTGVNFAKALSYFWEIPIIPINHIEAHIYANWLPPVGIKSEIRNPKSKTNSKFQNLKSENLFPAICLIVSGGHTQLILMKGFGRYKIIGETRDDAAGECFDKVARILGLGYPGGPVIAAKAAQLKTKNHELKTKLPRPMIHQKNYDFSFSGLKTAALYKVKQLTMDRKQLTENQIIALCKETQQAIIDVLIKKTIKAAKEYKAKTIILGGGVTANDELRRQLNHQLKTISPSTLSSGPKGYKLNFLVPQKNFCTDNAAMIGIAAHYHWLRGKGKNWREITAEANLRIG